MTSTVMKVTSSGQISIPAEVRRRWATDRVIVIETSDGLIIRPFDPAAVTRLRGKYRRRADGMTSEQNRAGARGEPARTE